jgi:hypothetical protein
MIVAQVQRVRRARWLCRSIATTQDKNRVTFASHYGRLRPKAEAEKRDGPKGDLSYLNGVHGRATPDFEGAGWGIREI